MGGKSVRSSSAVKCTCSTPSTPTSASTTSPIKKLYNIIHPSSSSTSTSTSLPLNNTFYNQFPLLSSSNTQQQPSTSNQLLNNLNEHLIRSSSSKLYNKPFTLLSGGGVQLQHSKMRRSISKDSIDDKQYYWGGSSAMPPPPPSMSQTEEGGDSAGHPQSNPSHHPQHPHTHHSFHLHPHPYHHHLYSSDGLPCSLIYRGSTGGGGGGGDSLPPQIEDYLKSSSSLLKNLNTSVSSFLYFEVFRCESWYFFTILFCCFCFCCYCWI